MRAIGRAVVIEVLRAQRGEQMARERERPVAVVSENVQVLDHQAAHDQFKKHLDSRPKLKKLHDEAQKRGYKPRDEPDQTFAVRVTAKASGDVHSTTAAGADAVQDVEFELVGQSVSKEDAEGAVATATIRGGGNEQTYEMLLEAPGGNFRQTREYKIDNDQVVEAHSWWSAWTGCLSRDCASTCLNSLWACTGTWTAYLWCVTAACGGCVAKCTGCATCDCSWWCRWAAGCCSQ
jgi:hypothetical protein